MTAGAIATDDGPPFAVQRAISDALDFVGKEPGKFWGLTFGLWVVPGLIYHLFDDGSAIIALTIPHLIYQVMIAMLFYQHACGQSVSLSAAAGPIRRMGSLIGLFILTGIGIGFGLILLVIPGIVLICMWFVAFPAWAIEGLSISDAMSRSTDLTKGSRLRILALLAFLTLPALFVMWITVPLLLIALIVTIAGTGDTFDIARSSPTELVEVALSLLQSVTVAVISGLAPPSVYVQLRRRREGVLVGNVPAVFG